MFLLSERNQLRDELSNLNKVVSTECLTTIILDTVPTEKYSTTQFETIKNPNLILEHIQRMMKTIFINHS